MRIAYPVILLGWIANPAQREQQGDTEHPPQRSKHPPQRTLTNVSVSECQYDILHLYLQ